MANFAFKPSEDMIIKLQLIKGKTKLKLYKTIRNYYDEMNHIKQSGTFQNEEDLSTKNVQSIGRIYLECLL